MIRRGLCPGPTFFSEGAPQPNRPTRHPRILRLGPVRRVPRFRTATTLSPRHPKHARPACRFGIMWDRLSSRSGPPLARKDRLQSRSPNTIYCRVPDALPVRPVARLAGVQPEPVPVHAGHNAKLPNEPIYGLWITPQLVVSREVTAVSISRAAHPPRQTNPFPSQARKGCTGQGWQVPRSACRMVRPYAPEMSPARFRQHCPAASLPRCLVASCLGGSAEASRRAARSRLDILAGLGH